jgi:hypothetical protein
VLHLLGLAGVGGLALAGYQASPAHAVFWVHPLNPRGHITRNYPFPSSIYNGGYHHALDYVSDGSLTVHSVASGTVQARDVASSGAAWGNYVLINHGESYWSSYWHLRDAPPVYPGQSIAAGQAIGTIGETGHPVYGAHLHLEIYQGGTSRSGPDQRVDPQPLVQNAPLPGSAIVSYNGSLEEDEFMYIKRNFTGEVAAFGGSWRTAVGGATGRHIFSSVGEYDGWRFIIQAYNGHIANTGSDPSLVQPVPPIIQNVMGVDESNWGIICGMYGV